MVSVMTTATVTPRPPAQPGARCGTGVRSPAAALNSDRPTVDPSTPAAGLNSLEMIPVINGRGSLRATRDSLHLDQLAGVIGLSLGSSGWNQPASHLTPPVGNHHDVTVAATAAAATAALRSVAGRNSPHLMTGRLISRRLGVRGRSLTTPQGRHLARTIQPSRSGRSSAAAPTAPSPRQSQRGRRRAPASSPVSCGRTARRCRAHSGRGGIRTSITSSTYRYMGNGFR